MLRTVCVAVFMATVDELTQIYNPTRGASFQDWLIDITGVILGGIAIRFCFVQNFTSNSSRG